MKYQLIFKNRTPLSFKANRSPSNPDTLDYIPGSSLMGALAGAHQKLSGDTVEFNEFFMDKNLTVSNMYPANFCNLNTAFTDNPFPVAPLPATAMSCKRFPGFRDIDKSDNEKHGVYDLLAYWSVFLLSGASKNEIITPLLKCRQEGCSYDITPFSGYYGIINEKENGLIAEKSTLKLNVITRTGIDRALGTVKQGILYNREMILEGQLFTGEILINSEYAQAFFAFLKEASESGYLRVGNSRSRGAGEITLFTKKEVIEDSSDSASIRERTKKFTDRINQIAAENKVNQPFTHLVPLTILSDTLILDGLLRNCTSLDAELWLSEISDIPAELVYSSTSWREAVGWNALYSVPREVSILINKGSVFVFGLNDPPESLWNDLSDIHNKGVGERTNDGMGKISVADKFHLEVFGV